jgi:hypothetical protein
MFKTFLSHPRVHHTYNPDTNISDLLDPECSSFYQHLIGVMRWMVKTGHVDIATEVSMLSLYLALPREGHLEAALHIMGYLRLKHNSRLIFDPTYPTIVESDFPQYDWTVFYGDIKEPILHDIPEPLGKEVEIRMMCDSDHAGCKRTHRSRMGILI